MKIFKKGITYLSKKDSTSKFKSMYKCLICGSIKEIRDSAVDSGHDRTCGCLNNHTNSIVLEITKEGQALSPTKEYNMIHKKANGYLGANVNSKSEYMHRLVALKFIPNPKNLLQINHINGIKTDNRVENLEWSSCSDNVKHAIRTGLNKHVKGQPSKKRKISEENVKHIKTCDKTLKELSSIYNISITALSNIRRGITYVN